MPSLLVANNGDIHMPILIRLIVMGLAALGIGGGLIAAGHLGDNELAREHQDKLDAILRRFKEQTGITTVELGSDADGKDTLDVKLPAGRTTDGIDPTFEGLVVRVEFSGEEVPA
jgi:hypothetical protein